MGRAHFLRLVGIVVMLIFVFVAIGFAARDSWLFVLVFGAVSALGLYIAVMQDKAIDRLKREAIEAREQGALAFNGSEFVVGLRWFRAVMVIAAFAGCCAFSVLLFLSTIGKGTYGLTLLTAALSVFFLACEVGILNTAYFAYRDSCLVRMDTFGIALWGDAPIAWKLIEGIDLKVEEVKSQKHYSFVLAIKRDYFLQHAPSKLGKWLLWTVPRQSPVSRTLNVPCAFLNAEPHLIVQAAKVIADRFGGERVKDWSQYISIDVAVASSVARANADGANQEISRLLSQLQVLSKTPDHNPQEVHGIERELEMQMQKLTAANDVQLKTLDVLVDQSKARLTKLKWAVGVTLALGLVAILLKMVSVAKH